MNVRGMSAPVPAAKTGGAATELAEEGTMPGVHAKGEQRGY